MKLTFLGLIASVSLMGLVACNDESSSETTTDSSTNTMSTMSSDTAAGNSGSSAVMATYVDVNTGSTVDLWWDTAHNYVADRKTGNRVDLYVNTSTNDTLWGWGEESVVVNNAIIKSKDNKYKLDDSKIKWEGKTLKIKIGDTKMKVKDGDTTIKN